MIGTRADAVDAIDVWVAVLDDFERVIERQADFLATGAGLEPSLTQFTPPPGLPPLPASLRDRAVELERRNDHLLALARELVAAAPAPVNTAPRRLPTASTRRSELDLRA